MFATALGGGILLDATLIRGVLAPAVVALLGHRNWWLPTRAARVLRVASDPVQARTRPSDRSEDLGGSSVVDVAPAHRGRTRRS